MTATTPRSRIRVGEAVDQRGAPLFIIGGVILAYTGVALLRPGLPQGLAFVDPLLLVLCAYSIVTMVYRGSPATSGALRLLPWFWLILLGSFLGLAGVGIPYWAMSNLARTVFALLTFVCMWHLIGSARLQRFAVIGTAIAMFITCSFLLVQSATYRGSAFFMHPNYTGHFCTMASFVLFSVSRRWYWKALTVIGLLIALQQTSSFGAIAMCIAMIGVYAVRALTRNTAILATGLAVLAIGGLFMATPQAEDLVPTDTTDWSFSQSISEERFERSGNTRLILWSQALEAYAQEPLGIGPDGVRRREVAEYRGTALEIHSDSLGYLVERGVVGLVGFIGLWATLWIIARKGGLARVLIVGMLVQGIFRETMHYRHMWLLLALAFALDYAKRDGPEPETEPDGGPDPDAIAAPPAPADTFFPGVARWPQGT